MEFQMKEKKNTGDFHGSRRPARTFDHVSIQVEQDQMCLQAVWFLIKQIPWWCNGTMHNN
jgi:hypothetical protein